MRMLSSRSWKIIWGENFTAAKKVRRAARDSYFQSLSGSSQTQSPTRFKRVKGNQGTNHRRSGGHVQFTDQCSFFDICEGENNNQGQEKQNEEASVNTDANKNDDIEIPILFCEEIINPVRGHLTSSLLIKDSSSMSREAQWWTTKSSSSKDYTSTGWWDYPNAPTRPSDWNPRYHQAPWPLDEPQRDPARLIPRNILVPNPESVRERQQAAAMK